MVIEPSNVDEYAITMSPGTEGDIPKPLGWDKSMATWRLVSATPRHDSMLGKVVEFIWVRKRQTP